MMSSMRSLLLLLVLVPGCMSQAEKDDIANICFAPERSGVKADKDTSQKAMKMATFLKEKLTTQKWKTWMKKASTMDPGRRAVDLKRAAEDAGLSSCPIVDEL
jgi:hypothetical protein